MEFFGLSQYGLTSPTQDMMRDDYKEPENTDENVYIQSRDKRNFGEKIRELDCYLGPADGFAYRSLDRLRTMRNSHMWKPVGPNDMYKYPGANSMNYGWWCYDSTLTDPWFRPRIYHGAPTSEMTRFVNRCLSINKYFKM